MPCDLCKDPDCINNQRKHEEELLLIPLRTQKARGVRALLSSHHGYVPEVIFVTGAPEEAGPLLRAVNYPKFARPCPITPQHGFVESETVVDAATAPERTTRFIHRFLAPIRSRLLARARDSQLLLGVWLPAPAKEALAKMLATPVRRPIAAS